MDDEQKKALFEKLVALAKKQYPKYADNETVRTYVVPGGVLVQATCELEGDVIHPTLAEYLWNHDRKCLIRKHYVLAAVGRDGVEPKLKEKFNSMHEAVAEICRSVEADLMGSVTFTVVEIYTTQGVPY